MVFRSLKKKWLIYFIALKNVILYSKKFENSKILIIQMDSLGDACTLIPVCKELEKTGYEFDIVCQKSLVNLWKIFFKSIRCYPINNGDWYSPENKKVINEYSENNYEVVFAVTISPFGPFLASFAKSKYRFGLIENGHYYKGARLLYKNIVNAAVTDHVSKRFQNLFSLYISDFSYDPRFDVNLENKFNKIVLIHPGGKWLPRRWPKNNFLKTATALADEGNKVQFLIHESEKDLLEYFRTCIKPNQISIVKTAVISDLDKAIRGCDLFIGNDSGPAHLANLYKKETIILWGPGNYQRIKPLGDNNTIIIKNVPCRPCKQYIHPLRCENGENICLQNIAVEEVLAIAKAKLINLK